MRIMALDVGERTVGVAVSDPLGVIAQGVETVRRGAGGSELERLAHLAQQYEVSQVVIGLPKNMNGSLGPQAEKVQAFADILQRTLGLPVVFWDERLSTVAAERTLLEADITRKKRKQVIDKLAATVILQGYLQYQGEKQARPENQLLPFDRLDSGRALD